jgi:hypothetical protein
VVEEPLTDKLAEEPVQIPKIIFIVPYREREEQYKFFSTHMKSMLEDKRPGEYKIHYIHQIDKRDFNRGAMKNIGFMYVKDTYPNDYKNITLVFNDIDIMPLSKNFFDYETVAGVVKHFYGFKHTLGGIVSMNAGDFEKINGFPNFWAWGYEDNLLQKRVESSGIVIDRSVFYPILDKNVLLLHDGITRVVNKHEFDRYIQMTPEGISSIHGLQYSTTEEGFVNVSSFSTSTEPGVVQNVEYDLRNGPSPFAKKPQPRRNPTMKMFL